MFSLSLFWLTISDSITYNWEWLFNVAMYIYVYDRLETFIEAFPDTTENYFRIVGIAANWFSGSQIISQNANSTH